MSGGEISGNSDSGVFVYYGIFEMSGGTISGNTATYNGGGVYVSSGRFEMSGGEISGNTASSWGGGVYVEGTFIKQSGGTIYGSTASDSLKNTAGGDSYGHAVFVSSLSTKKRNTTAGVGVTLNSGSTGGWE
jgi:hypothetical protein